METKYYDGSYCPKCGSDDIDVDFVSIIISSAVFDSGEEVPIFENGGIYIFEPVPPSSSFLVEPSTGLFPLTATFTNTSDLGSGNSIQYELSLIKI